MSSHLSYQPAIDGLRAVAVLSVLLYHVGIETLGGGYVGVDVFFVISGFLITRLIVREIETSGTFRFGRFYLRRLRRLLPALLATVAASFLAALLLLSPEQLTRFSASAGTALLSVSNFWFWSQAGYFDALSQTKPLLHTWSLGVEEQFYLLWPVTIFLLYRFFGVRVLLVLLALACVLSTGLAESWLRSDPAAAFYLLPARIAELGIGALLVWVVRRRPSNRFFLGLVSVVGLCLVGWAVFAYTDETPFPGLNALVPCLGAALLIYANDAGPVGYLLESRPAVFLGRISYSVYLVHWPMLVFWFVYSYEVPGAWQKGVIIGASILVGWLQFRYVEQRWRYPPASGRSSAPFLAGTLAGVLLVASLSAFGYRSGGIPARIPEGRLSLTDAEWRTLRETRYCSSPEPGRDKDLFTCQNHRGGDRQIILWGDSHALHLVSGFSEAYPDHDVHVIYYTGCVPQSGFGGYVRDYRDERTETCVRHNRRALELLLASEPTNVVLTSAKRSRPGTVAPITQDLAARLRSAGHTVAILGDFIRPGVPLRECTSRPAVVLSDEDIAERCAGDKATAERELAYNREFSKLLPEAVMPDELQCPDGDCRFYVDGKLLYRDHHHLNIDGSVYFVTRLRDRLPF